MKPQIRFVIADVHMGLGHDGLNEIIREHKKKNPLFAKTLQLEAGLILFMNRPKTRAKLFQENGPVIGYLRLDRGLSEDSIDLIPKTFGGSVEHSKAVKRALSSLLEKSKLVARVRAIESTVLHANA